MPLGVNELRALAHPTRLRILSLLTGAAMTAADVARELSLTHANASYHLRQLLAVGTIEVAGEEHIRGGVAKRYRYTVEPAHTAVRTRKTTPVAGNGEARRALLAILAGELERRSRLLRDDQLDAHSTDAELWVDPDVFTEVMHQVTDASRTLHLAAQPPRTPGTVRVNATMALFEMEPDG
jgi:DNA-binding transcriptional ArsR family regulator